MVNFQKSKTGVIADFQQVQTQASSSRTEKFVMIREICVKRKIEQREENQEPRTELGVRSYEVIELLPTAFVLRASDIRHPTSK